MCLLICPFLRGVMPKPINNISGILLAHPVFMRLGAVVWLYLASALSALAQQESRASGYSNILWLVITLMFLLQSLLIIGLQRSRLNNKRARKALKESQRELERKIAERTESLHQTNNRLQDEIARHEATVLLLRETQDYLHSMINSMPSVLIGVTHQGYVTHWNASAAFNTGISADEALHRHLNEVYPSLPISLATIKKTIESGAPLVNENMQQGQGTEARYMDMTIYPLIAAQGIGAVIRIDDVTLRVKMEHVMIQNEKMLSLGELAAGIAHEINNPIGAILHSVQNIYRRTSPELASNHEVTKNLDINVEQVYEYLRERNIYSFLEDIKEAGERAAKIVTNMLEFSHVSNRNTSMMDLKSVIDHSVELSINTGEAKELKVKPPKIVKDISTDLPGVMGSAPEIQQVILNLLRNARQALASDLQNNAEPQFKPTINIRAHAEATHVVIEVEDNGPGMPDSVKSHIFEPFYTTKEVGKGTGLGLSVSYFIITEHHKGKIEVDSTPGKGTRFTIRLPLPEKKM